MPSLTTAAMKKPAPVWPASQRGLQSSGNAGDSGWMHPENQQPMPKAKLGGPHRKMHAPGFRGRGK